VRHIAKLAGISPSAVSLALRQSPKVSAATALRVRRLAEQLGYFPDAKIRHLMAEVRATQPTKAKGCFGVISLYDHPRPWEQAQHLTRIYHAMRLRAQELGYRLESIWRPPGMTYQRLRAVLDARGIQGLLCFGGPEYDAPFPSELDHYAIVTVGLSIQTPLHRVTSHFYNDMNGALNTLHQLGYRRPGLVLSRRSELRSAHAYTSAFLGWCNRMLGLVPPLPVLRINEIEEAPLLAWLRCHQPDVLVIVHSHQALADLAGFLSRQKISVPRDLGVAAITHFLEDTPFSGMQQNQVLMGAWAVELLVARIMSRDFGTPACPRIEMVESHWVDGTSLRRIPVARR
jgi:DNA-binding LacI/PurR family transcriptional regulator